MSDSKFNLKTSRRKAEIFFRIAYPKQSEENVEDFGSYCVERWLDGRSIKIPFKFMAVDYLREFGMKVSIHGKSDVMSRPDNAELTELIEYDEKTFKKSDILRHKKLSKDQRALLILYFEWGLNFKEIGDLWGFQKQFLISRDG
jgi:hypothetical protein